MIQRNANKQNDILELYFGKKFHGNFLQVLLATCVLSKSVKLDLIPGNQTALSVEQEKLINTGNLILSRAVDCKAQGVSAISCIKYKVCIDIGGGIYMGAVGTCPVQQYFNPVSLQCDPNYVCLHHQPGFICLSSTSFTYFSDTQEVIVSNITCPPNHFCNKLCKHPCIKFVYNC